jgi:hypothetical protein
MEDYSSNPGKSDPGMHREGTRDWLMGVSKKRLITKNHSASGRSIRRGRDDKPRKADLKD